MARTNKRSKVRNIRKKQQSHAKAIKKQAKEKKKRDASGDNKSKQSEQSHEEDMPTTSKRAAAKENEATTPDETSTPAKGFWKVPKKREDNPGPSRKKARKQTKRLKPGLDYVLMDAEDGIIDNEPTSIMCYSEALRSGVDTSGNINYNQNYKQQSLNMGLDNFPALPPVKGSNSQFTIDNNSDEQDMSETCSEELSGLLSESVTTSDASSTTDADDIEPELEQLFEDMSLSPELNNNVCEAKCKTSGIEITSGICCEVNASTNATNSSADASEYDAADNVNASRVNTPASPHTTPAVSPQATFSPEWLDATVRYLSTTLNVSISDLNYTECDIEFPNFMSQFDDLIYAYVENKAMRALHNPQNK